MKISHRLRARNDIYHKILQSLNLRPEEGERTFLLFLVYTITSIGLLWVEQTAIALFLAPAPEGFGAKWLPVIYIASALMGSGLGVLFSWMQNNWPLPRVLLSVMGLIALPLLPLRFGLEIHALQGAIALASVFLLRLWMDAQDVLKDLNAQVTANQLFNIREIKRTYPIVSSGLLLGDVISGFSLPFLLAILGLNNVLVAASFLIFAGGIALYFLIRRYKQAFPNTPVRDLEELTKGSGSRVVSPIVKRYLFPLFLFFVMGQVLMLLVEFQYLGELEINFNTDQIAGFLGLFSGILGLFELITQWFVSSRAVERLGVFVAAMFLPVSLSVLGLITILLDKKLLFTGFDSAQILFFSALVLRFFDELLRYTLIAGIEPFLFQPLPGEIRNATQTLVQGVAEPITIGFTGVGILAATTMLRWLFPHATPARMHQLQGSFFVGAIVVFSIIWAASAWLLRSSYVNLLVQGAEQGRLGLGNVDLKAFKRAILESLTERETEADKRSCIELLERIDPENTGEILAPLLLSFSPSLQRRSLEAMLHAPSPLYREAVQNLIEKQPPLDVLALGLRYLWFCETDLNPEVLKPYLQDRVDPLVRGTAANLILQRGKEADRQLAAQVLATMLTSSRERDRVIGVQSLPQPAYFPSLDYIPQLLQDSSQRVRCALLEIVGQQRLTDYYPSLLRGLSYKSTREAAKRALVSLGNDGLALLSQFSSDPRTSEFLRLQVWGVLAEINTPETHGQLLQQMQSSWGMNRRNLLRVLLKMPEDRGIELVLDRLGRGVLENFLDQELLWLGHLYAAAQDFQEAHLTSKDGELIQGALEGMRNDVWERCFLIMQFLYPLTAIQAAILNLDSDNQSSIALGLELLDNTLDLPQKRLLLELLDGGLRAPLKNLGGITSLVPYQPLSPNDRLRKLVELRHFLSPWTLACCFHLARVERWSLSSEANLFCLRHPNNFVREAVLAYLRQASPRTCYELLPLLQNDSDPLVLDQVVQLYGELTPLYSNFP